MATDSRNTTPEPVRAPGWVRVLLELRAPMEFVASVAAAPWLLNAPRGDGHPVIVYPGFLATDTSTRPMRRLLRTLGHDVQGWGQGRNLGPRKEVLDLATEQIRTLAKKSGRKVSLVGWSLGGIYARELAKRLPQLVRCVISMGSPFAGSPEATNAGRVFEWVNRDFPGIAIPPEALHQAPPVPTTSIFSRTDGVVAWQCSIEPGGGKNKIENIEVGASHLGLGVSPFVLYALADRLSQPEGGWQPFDRAGLRRFVYPDPKRKRTRGW